MSLSFASTITRAESRSCANTLTNNWVAVRDQVTKTVAAAKEHRVKQILLVGGVASNKLLRQQLSKNSPIPVLVPEPVLCTDNAAMIAACGYYHFQTGKMDGLDLDVVPNLKLV